MDKEKTVNKGRKVKIVDVGQYLEKARKKNPETSTAWNDALILLYSENIIIDKIERKGETKFIVEA